MNTANLQKSPDELFLKNRDNNNLSSFLRDCKRDILKGKPNPPARAILASFMGQTLAYKVKTMQQ